MQKLAVVGGLCLVLVGCLENTSSNPSIESLQTEESADPPPIFDPDFGMKLEFYDLSEESERPGDFDFHHTSRIDVVGFTSHLELRGQSFREGIKKLTGEVLRAKNVDVLPAPFGMKIRGLLNLAEGQSEGEYQLAVLSNAPVRFRMLYIYKR